MLTVTRRFSRKTGLGPSSVPIVKCDPDHGVRPPPVHDPHPGRAAVDHAPAHQAFEALPADDVERVTVAVEDAGNVRELKKHRRAERRREHAGYVIGVDVVGRPVTPGRDGGDDGDQAVPIEKPQQVRVDRLDVADASQVRALAVRQPVRPPVGDDQVGVLAVEADRVAAVLVDEPHELGIDAAHPAPSPPAPSSRRQSRGGRRRSAGSCRGAA
jgi:hypothetical protein